MIQRTRLRNCGSLGSGAGELRALRRGGPSAGAKLGILGNVGALFSEAAMHDRRRVVIHLFGDRQIRRIQVNAQGVDSATASESPSSIVNRVRRQSQDAPSRLS